MITRINDEITISFGAGKIGIYTPNPKKTNEKYLLFRELEIPMDIGEVSPGFYPVRTASLSVRFTFDNVESLDTVIKGLNLLRKDQFP